MGTRGVPAAYGGFETAVEEIGSRLASQNFDVIVYCRYKRQALREYKGMRLHNLPALRRKSIETLSHTLLSTVHCLARSRPDAVLLFNAANAPFIPIIRLTGTPVITVLDGLEHRRAKWGHLGQRYFLWSERRAIKWSDEVIADSQGIAAYVRDTYGADTNFIPYGAARPSPSPGRLRGMGLTPAQYHLMVARFEPENHVLEILEGFSRSQCQLPLVVVGSAPYSDEYTARIRAIAEGDSRITLTGAVYDQELLDTLYAYAYTYLHGHSVGGTNPSLLRAMAAGTKPICYNVSFNREVAGRNGDYFYNTFELSSLLEQAERDPGAVVSASALGQADIDQRYSWDRVADQYANLIRTAARPLADASTVRPESMQ